MSSEIDQPVLEELYVVTLGQFRVSSDSRTIDEGAWVREKARILFQYFITNRSQFISRERIIYELWPDLDSEAARRDFKVALSAVNRALKGNQQRPAAAYIQRQGLTYGLNSSFVTVDADIFETKLGQGRREEKTDIQASISHYREGLEMYGGDYLPERLYDDWSSGERERLTTMFLLSSTALASLLLSADEPDEAILWSQRVTAVDLLWEEAYRIQIKAFGLKGNRPKSIQIYSRFRQILKEQLGLEPMAETTAIYNQIIGG